MPNDETIVAVFDTAQHAAAAVQDLKTAGIPDANITQHAGSTSAAASGLASGETLSGEPRQEQGFWASLFGAEPEHDHDTAVYDRSMQGGSTIVTVRGSGSHLDQVLDILERHNPIDIDERAASYGESHTGSSAGLTTGATTGTMAGSLTGSSTTTGNTTTGNATTGSSSLTGSTSAAGYAATRASGEPDTIQLSEETLAVGKRAINRGTTRVRRYVVETPVEEQVSLHDERVTIERRPVTDGRAVGSDSFGDKTIEVTETAEEAVVSKTARVKEEVVVRKEAADRTETVRDTLRREDVEITKEPGTATAGSYTETGTGTTGTSGTATTGATGTTSPYKPAV